MSITSRKRDLVYLAFFLIHIPVMFCVDLYPLYPESIRPQFMTNLRTWYITTYNDRFFTTPPAWFSAYMWMEALYHVPLSFWAIGALLRDDPKLPIHLLVYAVQTAVTTLTCIADYLSWTGFSNAQKIELGKLYVPYLALSVWMGVDMYSRLDKALSRNTATSAKKRS
ncbi:transmembrane protein 6/97 [Neohortaea acidophila]|uniref:Efficient mitochondria targeting-associated protein 19 n=1 Tax=Neohortaea acidophila TaxID=245834 RepID=A0A6A6PY96_9PEZI|nr:transmembrane protein 6/97 [Neohortaea acidophila]KAF2484965.1 transmembrane protein 6/97 [Neohortaea acidophila]